MKKTTYFILYSLIIILVFGGTTFVRYYQTGELLVDQLIVVLIALIALISSLILGKINEV